MDALPAAVSETAETLITGITCPDCEGALEVRRERKGSLRFLCRVKHTFSVEELLTGKEEMIEAKLWESVRAIEELVALLHDLDVYAQRWGRAEIGGPHDERIARARHHAGRLRAILDDNRPVELTLPDVPRT
jgi:two-component system chemotaxis response regulator CheB